MVATHDTFREVMCQARHAVFRHKPNRFDQSIGIPPTPRPCNRDRVSSASPLSPCRPAEIRGSTRDRSSGRVAEGRRGVRPPSSLRGGRYCRPRHRRADSRRKRPTPRTLPRYPPVAARSQAPHVRLRACSRSGDDPRPVREGVRCRAAALHPASEQDVRRIGRGLFTRGSNPDAAVGGFVVLFEVGVVETRCRWRGPEQFGS